MRTPEQIHNLRLGFSLIFGPYALMAPNSIIDMLADRLQDRINNGRKIWTIQVRLSEDLKWEDIPFEPVMPTCHTETVVKKAWELLDKYPAIISIKITQSDDVLNTFTFQRPEIEVK